MSQWQGQFLSANPLASAAAARLPLWTPPWYARRQIADGRGARVPPPRQAVWCIVPFWRCIAAKRERIDAPEPGRDRIGIDAVGHFLRHLGKIGPEGVERGFSVAKSRFGPQIIGDDAGLARLNAARLPQILEAEIGIERAIRRRGKTRVGAPPHARQVCISTPTSEARFCNLHGRCRRIRHRARRTCLYRDRIG